MINLNIIHGAFVQVSKMDGKVIQHLLSYKEEIMVKRKMGRNIVQKKKVVTQYAWAFKDKNMYTFYRGHLSKVIGFLKSKNIPYQINGRSKKLPCRKHNLNGIILRPDQLELTEKALQYNRGVIKAPTGSGKSIVISAIMSSYFDSRILVITHLSDLVTQLKENFEKYLGEEVTKLSSAHPESFTRITITTIQTLAKLPPETYAEEYDVVIVDEAHRISTIKPKKQKDKTYKYGQYLAVLSTMDVAHRFGFTATLPYIESSKTALEGLIGPVIGELTIAEAADLSLLAKPQIKLIKTPIIPELEDVKNYRDAYRIGIVANDARNTLIIQVLEKLMNKGETALIIVNHVAHGHWLQDKAKSLLGIKLEYVHGAVDKETRNSIKKRLIAKEIPATICTSAWIEGIDLPSLGAVINAGGGKSEIRTIQAIGRGLRKTKDKDTVTIVDFFDPSSTYFVNHFSYRLCLYFEQGWLGTSDF